jgi:hypothetical protein
MAVGLSGRPSVRERVARTKASMMQQQQFDPQKLAGGVLRGDISSSDVNALQSMGVLPQQETQPTIAEQLAAKEGGYQIVNGQIVGSGKTNTYDVNNISQLSSELGRTKGEREAPADLSSFLQESQNALKGLSGKRNIGLTTGKLSMLTGLAPDSKIAQTRSDVATLGDKIRNELFGAAVTELELQRGNVPDKSKQEGYNKRAITSLMKRASNELENKLSALGFTDEQIDLYYQSKFGTRTPWLTTNEATGETTTTSGFNEDELLDDLGI